MVGIQVPADAFATRKVAEAMRPVLAVAQRHKAIVFIHYGGLPGQAFPHLPGDIVVYTEAKHAGLAEELPASAVVRAVAAQLKAAIGAVRAFQATLSPDAVLRRLVQLGRCRACS